MSHPKLQENLVMNEQHRQHHLHQIKHLVFHYFLPNHHQSSSIQQKMRWRLPLRLLCLVQTCA
ncbi:MAG: hypothetical protein EBS87_12315 [Sphingomonadaceae bacterium]|nr:hypothetical protein [Sphingomonadaceae bacterium]